MSKDLPSNGYGEQDEPRKNSYDYLDYKENENKLEQLRN